MRCLVVHDSHSINCLIVYCALTNEKIGIFNLVGLSDARIHPTGLLMLTIL